MNIQDLYKKFITDCGGQICTDTRKIIPGSLFFAWKGEEHDGNKYAGQALELGCAYVVIDNPDYAKNEKYILVENSTEALVQLARYHRMQFNIPVVAITGSNGKTTTKNLLTSILKTQKNVVSPKKSYNNNIGVSKTLLDVTKETEIVVVELGANHIGEIADLCEIAMPTHGIITNIGRAHIGLFGGFEGVVRTKKELYEYLKKNGGEVFVNASDDLLREKSEGMKRIMYGPDFHADPIISLNTIPLVSFNWCHSIVQSQLTGEYNIDNISAAISIATHFEIRRKGIVKGIEGFQPMNARSEIYESKKGNIVIKDYYNANNSSMKAALSNLKNIQSNKIKIAILGDMFDLGEFEHEEHRDIMNTAINMDLDMLVLVGEAFSKCVHDYSNIYQYKTIDLAIKSLKDFTIENSIILLKGSRGPNPTPAFQKIFDEIDW